MTLATIIFLCIGAFGIIIAALAIFGGSVFDIGDGLLSVEGVSAFFAGLGFSAAAANELWGDSIGVFGSTGVGIIVAVPAALLSARLMTRMSDMQTDATPTVSDLMGARGVVVTPIPAGGFGEVRVRVGGQPMKLYARAESPIALGAAVVVTVALSETSVLVTED